MVVQMEKVEVVFAVFNLSVHVCEKSAGSSISLDSLSSTFGQHFWEYGSAMSTAKP